MKDDNVLEEIIQSIKKDENFKYVNRDDRPFTTFSYYIKLNIDSFCFENDGLWGFWTNKLYVITGMKTDYLLLECSSGKLSELKKVIENYFKQKKDKALNVFRTR
jgi:hypothetical protein